MGLDQTAGGVRDAGLVSRRLAGPEGDRVLPLSTRCIIHHG